MSLRPDDDAVRRARAAADRLRAEAAVERRLSAVRSGRRGRGSVTGAAAGTRVRGRVVGGDLAEPLAALEASGWLLLHDVARRWSRLPVLDHVAVGPAGVLVVQQVRFEGVVAVADGVLRLNGAPYAVETGRVVAAAALVRAALAAGPARQVPLRTVLCVVPAGPAAAGVVRPGVDVVDGAGLAGLVADRPAVLAPDAAAGVRDALAAALRTGDGLRRACRPAG